MNRVSRARWALALAGALFAAPVAFAAPTTAEAETGQLAEYADPEMQADAAPVHTAYPAQYRCTASGAWAALRPADLYRFATEAYD